MRAPDIVSVKYSGIQTSSGKRDSFYVCVARYVSLHLFSFDATTWRKIMRETSRPFGDTLKIFLRTSVDAIRLRFSSCRVKCQFIFSVPRRPRFKRTLFSRIDNTKLLETERTSSRIRNGKQKRRKTKVPKITRHRSRFENRVVNEPRFVIDSRAFFQKYQTRASNRRTTEVR